MPVRYVCSWTAKGRVGASPAYECDSKATFREKLGKFEIKVCKSQLGAQLWDELVRAPLPVKPDFTGVCDEVDRDRFKCKWFGEGGLGLVRGEFCKGFGIYDAKAHRWRLDPCVPPGPKR